MTTPSPSSGPRPPTRSSTQSDDTANASPDQDTRRRRPYPENEACQASSCQHRRRAAVQPTDLAPRRGPPPPAPLLLFVIRPEWSYRLNADFEDHAEHEYMLYVAEHPELEAQPDPGTYGSLADLFRQIGHDERVHKQDSLVNMRAPRVGHNHLAG